MSRSSIRRAWSRCTGSPAAREYPLRLASTSPGSTSLRMVPAALPAASRVGDGAEEPALGPLRERIPRRTR